MRKAWTPEQIDTFMVELKRLFVENPAIESFRSLIALDRVKAETGVIIP